MKEIIDWLEENHGTLKFGDETCCIGALNRFVTFTARASEPYVQRRAKLLEAWLTLRKLVGD